jgi:hypothetical protein
VLEHFRVLQEACGVKRALTGTTAILASLCVTCGARESFAELRAHLHVDTITQIGAVATTDGNDQLSENSGAASGEEPFWQVAILDDAGVTDTETSEFTSWTEPGCANWDVTSTLVVDQEFVRVVPDQAEAAFYIGVFDYDAFNTNNLPSTILAELLGDHFWTGALDASTVAVGNDNDAPFHFDADGELCDLSPTGLGATGNWQATFRSWYDDTDGPAAATGLMHVDAGAPEDTNDDAVMSFAWTPGGDPHSGTAQVVRLERLSDEATCEHALAPAAASFSFSVGEPMACDAGGTLDGSTMPLQEGESYVALLRTRNGVEPEIENPASIDSAPTPPILQSALASLLFQDGFEPGNASAWSTSSDG